MTDRQVMDTTGLTTLRPYTNHPIFLRSLVEGFAQLRNSYLEASTGDLRHSCKPSKYLRQEKVRGRGRGSRWIEPLGV
jgi:hypothetical protein